MHPIGFSPTPDSRLRGKKLTIEKEIKKLKVQRIINDQPSLQKSTYDSPHSKLRSIHDDSISEKSLTLKKRENPATRWEKNEDYRMKVGGFKMPIDETFKYEQNVLKSSKKIKSE